MSEEGPGGRPPGLREVELQLAFRYAVKALISLRGLALDALLIALEEDAQTRRAKAAQAVEIMRESGEAIDELLEHLKRWQ